MKFYNAVLLLSFSILLTNCDPAFFLYIRNHQSEPTNIKIVENEHYRTNKCDSSFMYIDTIIEKIKFNTWIQLETKNKLEPVNSNCMYRIPSKSTAFLNRHPITIEKLYFDNGISKDSLVLMKGHNNIKRLKKEGKISNKPLWSGGNILVIEIKEDYLE